MYNVTLRISSHPEPANANAVVQLTIQTMEPTLNVPHTHRSKERDIFSVLTKRVTKCAVLLLTLHFI